MLISKKISYSFLLCAIFISSCTAPVTPKQNEAIKAEITTNKEETKVVLKETNIQFTQKIDGIDNPIAPDNIESIEVGDKIIPVKEIKIDKSKFSTKATSEDISIEYLGSGRFKFKLKDSNKFNNASVNFNLASPKKTVGFPLLKELIDNNLRLSYDPVKNKVFGAVSDKDGNIDKSKPIFNIENNKLIFQEFNGKESIYDIKDFLKPEKITLQPKEYVNEQIEKLNKEIPPPSPFYPYVGSWAFNFSAKAFGIPGYNETSGQRLTVTFIDLGNSKFKMVIKSFDLVGNATSEDYPATGSYSNPSESIFASFGGNDWDIKLIGDNLLEAKLKFSLIPQYKPFQGFMFSLPRVPNPNYTGS